MPGLFTVSIYDVMMELGKLPYLPRVQSSALYSLVAKVPVCAPCEARVGVAVQRPRVRLWSNGGWPRGMCLPCAPALATAACFAPART